MPPGKRRKRGTPTSRPKRGIARKRRAIAPSSSRDARTLAGASRAGIEEMLGPKEEETQTDNVHHLDQVASVLNAPNRKSDVTVGECGAPAKPENGASPSADSDVEWQELDVQETTNSGLAIDLGAAETEPTDGKRKLSKEERDLQKSLAQVSFLLDIAQGFHIDKATDDPLLQSRMLSIVPTEFLDPDVDDVVEWMKRLFEWFSQTFTKLTPQPIQPPKHLIKMAKPLRRTLNDTVVRKEGRGEHLNAVFAALLKSLKFHTRIVRLLEMQPGTVFASDKAKKTAMPRKVKQEAWCEVWMNREGKSRWIHVSPLFELVDSPLEVPNSAQNSKAIYVVAYCGGGARDVSPRYISNVVRCMRLQKDKWWRAVIEPYTETMMTSLREQFSSATKRIRNLMEKEEEELELMVAERRKQNPKTLEEFKCSLNYVLPRHIKRYEGLKPKSRRVGQYRNEPYYARTDLADLHSKTRWIRHGRVVKESELPRPHKLVKKLFGCGKKLTFTEEIPDDDEEEEGEEEMLGLYGEWQTTKWKAPVAKDGVVPKNDYGKVDLPPLVPSLPKNTTHVTLPRIVPICRQLGIDYAIATVGFEQVRGGKQVPKLDGVVICTEDAQRVFDAYEEREKALAEAEYQERMASGKEGWMKLLRAIHTHLALQKRYVRDHT